MQIHDIKCSLSASNGNDEATLSYPYADKLVNSLVEVVTNCITASGDTSFGAEIPGTAQPRHSMRTRAYAHARYEMVQLSLHCLE